MNPSTPDRQVFSSLQNRILTHWHEARQILDGQMPPPRTAIVYPTYVCNQNCLWCEYGEDNTDFHTMMPTERLRALMWDLRALGVRAVEFCGGGEPTLHPALAPLVREMKERGMSTGVLTNGSRLRGELAEALVDCASYVRVGFDAGTAEKFNEVKRPRTPEARFDAVCDNVRALLALRKERGTNVLISMKIVLDAHNYHEIEPAVDLALELGVDSIQFKAARLTEAELNEAQSAEVQRALESLRAQHPGLPIVGSVEKLNMASQCWLTPLQITVDTLGEVYLCCYFRHRRERHGIGNAFERPLHEIWHGERHREAIRDIRPHECNNLDCRFVHYNRILRDVMVDHDAQFEFI